MSSIVVAGDVSGSVTIAAPSAAGSTTLTLPSTSGTIITTASSTGLDASVISSGTMATARLASGSATSSTYLRGDQTWSTISSGGMTLLGTLTTTSGSTQTLSGLTLTGYKALFISFNAVSCTGAGNININTSYKVGPYLDGASDVASGISWLDLSNGVVGSAINVNSYPYTAGSVTNITTASTSISFNSPATTSFDAGSIKVYGVA